MPEHLESDKENADVVQLVPSESRNGNAMF
jgi:hypothetical protein